ncbi:MAG: DNA primase [Candidatus Riflebacteria bacterium]|nr:DNA primase [Candidatus Riflebacteria bacterium]
MNNLKSGFIPEDLIEEIRQKTDIVQIIGEYVKLIKSGKTYKALCPFHQEKTPSFHVVPEKQIYHCFGCNKGGNSFKFLMEVERLSFPEAARFLAKRSGVHIPEFRDPESDRKNKLYKVLDDAASIFSAMLFDSARGKSAREYLSKRGITSETCRKYRIGYSLDQYDFLIKRLGGDNEKLQILEKTGLIHPLKERSGFCDTFRNRLIIPITDIQGRVIAFGGRTIENREPKYLNSPESEVFHKRNTLFNFKTALQPIRKRNRALLVEGYLDVISLDQAGIDYSVATLGTAVSPEQMALLARNCDEVVLCYDADEAGQRATLRAISIKRDVPLNARVFTFPDPKDDPDSYIRREGAEKFEKLLEESRDIYTFIFERQTKGVSKPLPVNVKEKLIAEFKPVFASVESPVAQEEIIRKLSSLLELSPEMLSRVFQGKMSRSEISKPQTTSGKNISLLKSQEFIIRHIIEEPDLFNKISSILKSGDFTDQQLLKIFEFVLKLHSENNSSFHPSMLLTSLTDESLVSRLSEMMVAIEENPLPPLDECVQIVVKDRLNREMKDISKQIQIAEQKGDSREVNRLLALHAELGQRMFGGKNERLSSN